MDIFVKDGKEVAVTSTTQAVNIRAAGWKPKKAPTKKVGVAKEPIERDDD